MRWTLGISLAANELIWWCFRYSHEGLRIPNNLPLQLCDVTLWAAVLACIFMKKAVVEFTYFAGIAGAGMALLTPDLWSPWPSYPAIYFFVAHGGIVIVAVVLVFGQIAPLGRNALWRAWRRNRARRQGQMWLLPELEYAASPVWLIPRGVFEAADRAAQGTLFP